MTVYPEKKLRDSSVELLRIVLTLMIVLYHFILHDGVGLDLDTLYNGHGLPQSYTPHVIVLPMLCFHVNCFVFISGYYGIKIKMEKVLHYVLMLLFYSLLTFLLSYFWNYIHTTQTYHLNDLIKACFPISSNVWWFFSYYFFLMLISPIINKGCDALKKEHFLIILFVMFLCCISLIPYYVDIYNSPFLFIFMYLCGRYLNRFSGSWIEKYSRLLFVLSLICLGCIMIYKLNCGYIGGAWPVMVSIRYNNPLVIMAAISCFFTFKKMNIPNNKWISFFSSSVFAVYLFTEGWSKGFLYKFFIGLSNSHMVTLIMWSFVLLVLIVLIDKLRNVLFAPIEFFIVKKINSIYARNIY